MELVWIVYCAATAFAANGALDPASCQAVTLVVADCQATVAAYKTNRVGELIAEGAQLYPGGKGFLLCEGHRFDLP